MAENVANATVKSVGWHKCLASGKLIDAFCLYGNLFWPMNYTVLQLYINKWKEKKMLVWKSLRPKKAPGTSSLSGYKIFLCFSL